MKKIFNFILVFLILFFFHNRSFASDNDIYKKIDLFSEVLETIKNEYVDEVDQSEAMDSAINGLLQSLDPYSAYMSPEAFSNMQTDTSGKFGGLGIEVTMESGVVKVITPLDGTPAAKAGVKAGDFIVQINGEQVQGKTLMEAVNLMRGEVGSPIQITIRRKGKKRAIEIKIIREIIQVKSVTSKIIDDIGYLRLTSFNENSSVQLRKNIKKIESKNKFKGFILAL